MSIDPQPKKRDREGSIQKLLDAGVHVFSTLGYDAATTKVIAKHAGINESLISRYFDGKAGLLVEIIRDFLDKECEHSQLKSYAHGTTLEEDIRNFFHYKFNHYLKIQSFLKVVFSRAIMDHTVAQEMQKKTYKGGAPRLLEHLQVFQQNGQIRPDVNLERACFTISHTCFSMGFLGYTVMGLEKTYILSALSDFARDFATGISAKTESQ